MTDTRPIYVDAATGRLHLTDPLRQECRARLLELRCQDPRIRTAGLVSSDGFEIAASSGHPVSVEKMAALASTVVAVAQTFLKESGLEDLRSVLFDSATGSVLLVEVRTCVGSFALFVVAQKEILLGRVLSLANRCALDMAELLSSREKTL